jgi:hypothetical protein
VYNQDSSTPQIRNSIIYGNTATGPDISNSSSTPVITRSIVQGSGGSGSWVAATSTNGGDNPDTEPLFAGSGDYRLNAGSPAIGAGNGSFYPANADDPVFPSGLSSEARAAINAALPYDLDGNPRKAGAIDMGAYERQ